MDPDFTVVLPTRGDSLHLGAALASALAAASSLEVLVARDPGGGRQPLPGGLVADPRVRVLDALGRGPAAARNAALGEARGRYVAFLDDDDLWLPEHLAWSREMLDRHEAALLVASDARLHEGDADLRDIEHLPRFRPGAAEGPISYRDLLLANPILTPTVVLRRERLDPGDRFDESLPVMEDYDLWLRLARKGELVFDPRPGVIVRKRAGSASRDLRAMAECSLRVLGRALEVQPNGSITAGERRRRLGRLWHDLAYACLLEGDTGAARAAVRQSVSRLPLIGKNYIYLISSFFPESARRAVFARRRAS